MKQKPILRIVLNGTEDEMFEMLRGAKVALAEQRDGKRVETARRIGGKLYSLKVTWKGVEMWSSK